VVAELSLLIRRERRVNLCRSLCLAGELLLVQCGDVPADRIDLIRRTGLDRRPHLSMQRVHLIVQAFGGHTVFLKSRMHGILLRGIQT
jgi:hypothetical protein